MYRKGFFYINALIRVLPYKEIGNGFSLGIHLNGFYHINTLKIVSLYNRIGKGFTI